jgi:hypothetical protein
MNGGTESILEARSDVTARSRGHVAGNLTCAVASWLSRGEAGSSQRRPIGSLNRVASFRARLRQPSRPECVAQGRIALAVYRRAAVQSVRSGLHRRSQHLMSSLPNNAFEPTLESSATSLRVECGAAQRNR